MTVWGVLKKLKLKLPCMLVTQSCPVLCDPMDCSLPGSSVHGLLQARILEWGALSFSRGSSRPRNWPWVSCIAGRFFTVWATREALFRRVSRPCDQGQAWVVLIKDTRHSHGLWWLVRSPGLSRSAYSSGPGRPEGTFHLWLILCLSLSSGWELLAPVAVGSPVYG